MNDIKIASPNLFIIFYMSSYTAKSERLARKSSTMNLQPVVFIPTGARAQRNFAI